MSEIYAMGNPRSGPNAYTMMTTASLDNIKLSTEDLSSIT